MVEWNDYLNHLLSSESDFDNITISLDEDESSTGIPPIIKASISMLDKMIENQGNRNLLVFPEKTQSIFIFTLMKLFHNIASGRIKGTYDPTKFTIGEKIKVGNTIVEYRGIEARNDHLCLIIKTADVELSAPIRLFPIFQKVNTKRRLSKYAQFLAAQKDALSTMSSEVTGSAKISYVSNMKTHIDSSIFVMTSVTAVKEQLSSCMLNGEKVTQIFHIAQTDYEGNVSNISSGQMSGIPAIIFSSDLYSIEATIAKGSPVQSIIIDGSNLNALLGQLDILDELLKMNIPIVCITDTADSFELEPYIARKFNIWRWNQETLSDELYDAVSLSSDVKTKNCATQRIHYLQSDGKEISEAMKLLSAHRSETKEQSPNMMRLFEMLNNLMFTALRTTSELSSMDREMANRIIDDCTDILSIEKTYLADDTVSDYNHIISNLKTIYGEKFIFTKSKVLQDYLRKNPMSKIYLIIPEKFQKDQIQRYWTQWCLRSRTKNQVKVLFPSEYYLSSSDGTDITVICGWMKRAIMRKIIYSFNTSQYIILLYDYENRWKKHDTTQWDKSLRQSSNKSIIENSFSSKEYQVSTERYDIETGDLPQEENIDELGEIELILRENKFRQYINDDKHRGKDIVSAIPVNFVGGYLSFFRTGHKLISATKIINSASDNIDSVIPTELKIGDFIVVREADKDIIKELADIVLKNSGKSNLRELASKWREALKIELLFCTIDELYEKFRAAGCDKGLPTIKNWIEDEEAISPRSKEDLKIIATVTENEMLIELLDDVYQAAQDVRKAHILAGRKLSEQLKLKLANELKKYQDLDPFNIWEPIEMDIEGIGPIKVLKIIDIGSEINVSATDTNRLIED
ncbi:MAG: DrmE family protein [Erysipelotrichaceae bacterium]|nr:DrmE family protein [Erysipelotrichaceae bacterium]